MTESTERNVGYYRMVPHKNKFSEFVKVTGIHGVILPGLIFIQKWVFRMVTPH